MRYVQVTIMAQNGARMDTSLEQLVIYKNYKNYNFEAGVPGRFLEVSEKEWERLWALQEKWHLKI